MAKKKKKTKKKKSASKSDWWYLLGVISVFLVAMAIIMSPKTPESQNKGSIDSYQIEESQYQKRDVSGQGVPLPEPSSGSGIILPKDLIE